MKEVFLVGILSVLVLLAGCSKEAKTADTAAVESNLIMSDDLYAIAGMGEDVRCVVLLADTYEYDMWIKDQTRFRVEDNEGPGNLVYDGVVIYNWMDGDTKGVMFDIPKMQALAGELSNEQQIKPPPSGLIEIALMATDVSCYKESVPDSFVSRPSGVDFQDFTELMQDDMPPDEYIEIGP